MHAKNLSCPWSNHNVNIKKEKLILGITLTQPHTYKTHYERSCKSNLSNIVLDNNRTVTFKALYTWSSHFYSYLLFQLNPPSQFYIYIDVFRSSFLS